MEAGAALESYLLHLRAERRLSPLTSKAYERDLALLLELSNHKPFEQKTHDLRLYSAKLNSRGLNARSIARSLSAWRGFYAWCAARGLVESNPAQHIKAPRARKLLPKALAVDDAVALAQFAASDSALDLRDHAIVELLYSSGLRLAELVSMDLRHARELGYESLSWLEASEAQAQILGKGNKRRIVPVGEAALVAIAAWQSARESLVKPAAEAKDRHALFLSRQGTRLSARSVQQRLAELAKKAGAPVALHPHVLRHSTASHLLQSSGDLRAVQELLGHASIASTQIYTKLDWAHLSAIYDKAHPRAKRKA
jgi:integrase/recombinase XerC